MRAVIFDLDGTLIDSAPDIQFALNRLMRELGAPEFDLFTVASYIGNGVRKLVERAMKRNDMDMSTLDANAERFKTLYEEAPAVSTIVFEGVPQALAALRAAGFKLAICTNKPERAASLILDDLKLSQYFDTLIGGDTTAKMKPDPLPLLEAMKRLGASPSETVFVGDSGTDAQTAKAAHLPLVFYEGGYCHQSTNEIHAAARFQNYGDLAAIIQNL